MKIRYRINKKSKIMDIEEIEKGIDFQEDIVARDMETGFKDKNGNEIFNNDVIKWKWRGCKTEYTGLVRFHDGIFFVFDLNADVRIFLCDIIKNGICEVIGNAYNMENMVKGVIEKLEGL